MDSKVKSCSQDQVNLIPSVTVPVKWRPFCLKVRNLLMTSIQDIERIVTRKWPAWQLLTRPKCWWYWHQEQLWSKDWSYFYRPLSFATCMYVHIRGWMWLAEPEVEDVLPLLQYENRVEVRSLWVRSRVRIVWGEVYFAQNVAQNFAPGASNRQQQHSQHQWENTWKIDLCYSNLARCEQSTSEQRRDLCVVGAANQRELQSEIPEIKQAWKPRRRCVRKKLNSNQTCEIERPDWIL